MKKTVVVASILMSLLLAGCGNSGASNSKATTSPSAEVSSGVQETSRPAENTALEDELPSESFFSYSGSGDDVVVGLNTTGYSFLKATNAGNHHFSIWAYYGEDDRDLLVNTSDPYIEGCTLLLPNEEYTLEVSATGEWSIEAYEIGTSSTDQFSVSGDYVTPLFLSTSDVYEVTSSGGGHFSIWAYTSDGDRDLLVNTSDDDYSGKVMLKCKGEYCFFEINSERDVTIQPVQ